jgi:hypothetical protein
VPLFEDYQAGRFEKLTDLEAAEEILLFLQNLEGIASRVRSDHILNLFEDIQGTLPEDKERMTGVIKAFLAMPPHDRMLYQVGRRLGQLRSTDDLENPGVRSHLEDLCLKNGITPDNVDAFINEMMKRFI